jgi:hypothetical protein
MHTSTKTAACKQSMAETSNLSRFGGQWHFSYYDPRAKAWREFFYVSYSMATTERRRHLVERAREIMRPDDIDGHQYEPGDLMGGKWQSYV